MPQTKEKLYKKENRNKCKLRIVMDYIWEAPSFCVRIEAVSIEDDQRVY